MDKEGLRVQKRSDEMAKAKAAFDASIAEQKAAKAQVMDGEDEEDDEEYEEFDEEDFTNKYDEENPPYEIPPEVSDDLDNDYNFADDDDD